MTLALVTAGILFLKVSFHMCLVWSIYVSVISDNIILHVIIAVACLHSRLKNEAYFARCYKHNGSRFGLHTRSYYRDCCASTCRVNFSVSLVSFG